jgi:hypothetical protein
MVSMRLIEELDKASAEIGGISKVQPDVAASYVQQLMDMYVADPSRLWWWEALKVPSDHLRYGDTDSLNMLASLIDEKECSILIVTDDSPPPWPIYCGRTEGLIEMLRNSGFFEYAIAAEDLSWVVFDTHMNELVRIGGRLI